MSAITAGISPQQIVWGVGVAAGAVATAPITLPSAGAIATGAAVVAAGAGIGYAANELYKAITDEDSSAQSNAHAMSGDRDQVAPSTIAQADSGEIDPNDCKPPTQQEVAAAKTARDKAKNEYERLVTAKTAVTGRLKASGSMDAPLSPSMLLVAEVPMTTSRSLMTSAIRGEVEMNLLRLNGMINSAGDVLNRAELELRILLDRLGCPE